MNCTVVIAGESVLWVHVLRLFRTRENSWAHMYCYLRIELCGKTTPCWKRGEPGKYRNRIGGEWHRPLQVCGKVRSSQYRPRQGIGVANKIISIWTHHLGKAKHYWLAGSPCVSRRKRRKKISAALQPTLTPILCIYVRVARKTKHRQ